MLLYGSDDVIKAYDAWIRYADMEKHDLDREGELISLFFLAIRITCMVIVLPPLTTSPSLMFM